MTARKLLVNLRHVKNECAFIRGFSRFILIKVLLLITIIIGIGLKRDGGPSIFAGKICANILRYNKVYRVISWGRDAILEATDPEVFCWYGFRV